MLSDNSCNFENQIIVTEIGALNKVPKDAFLRIAPFSTCNLYLL